MATGFNLSDTPARGFDVEVPPVRGVDVSSRNRLGEMLAGLVTSPTTLVAEMVRKMVNHGLVSSATVVAVTLALRIRRTDGQVLSRTTLAVEPVRRRTTDAAVNSVTTVTTVIGGTRGVSIDLISVTDVAGEPLRIRQLQGVASSITTISDELRNLTYLTDEDSEYLTDEDGEPFLILS